MLSQPSLANWLTVVCVAWTCRYRLLTADRITLFLVDPVKRELWIAVSKVRVAGCSGDVLACPVHTYWRALRYDQDAGGTRVPIGKGIAGFVALNGVTVNVPDASVDERFNPDVDVATGYTTKSVLAVPVRSDPGGPVLAVVQVLYLVVARPCVVCDADAAANDCPGVCTTGHQQGARRTALH